MGSVSWPGLSWGSIAVPFLLSPDGPELCVDVGVREDPGCLVVDGLRDLGWGLVGFHRHALRSPSRCSPAPYRSAGARPRLVVNARTRRRPTTIGRVQTWSTWVRPRRNGPSDLNAPIRE